MMMESTHAMSAAELRKLNKPLVEKKRRARINENLNHLKALLVESAKHDSARFSKLEKADILELTVQTLKQTQRQQTEAAVRADPTVAAKYQSGFTECAKEVKRYLDSVDGLGNEVRMRLMSHLARCMHKINTDITQYHPQVQQQQVPITHAPYATPVSTLPGSARPVTSPVTTSPQTPPHGQNYNQRDLSPNAAYHTTPILARQHTTTYTIAQPVFVKTEARTPSPAHSPDMYSVHIHTSPSSHSFVAVDANRDSKRSVYKAVSDRKQTHRRERVWRPW